MAALNITCKGAAKCVPADPGKMLLPFQEDWRSDRSRIKLAEKSRQIGWTWTDALDSMETCVGRELDVWVSSRDELQAKLYIDDAAQWAKTYQAGADALGLVDILDEQGKSHQAQVLRFPGGQAIHSLSSSPDAQAGKRGTRKLDEFALHKDPRRLYAIAYPGITWGGQLSIFSTHRGRHNFFNKLVEEIREGGNPKKISLHRVTLQDALEQGLLYKLQQRLPAGDERLEMDEADYFDYIRGGCADEESFQQEYMCIPADDASAFLSYDLIDPCTYPLAEDWERTPRELADAVDDLYVGVDVGRTKDLTVIWVMQRSGGLMLTRAMVTLSKLTFTQQEHILYEFLGLPRMRRCCIDSTGLGMQLAERAQERFGKYRIEAVNFSGPVKEELAYPVRSAFEDRTLRIPNDKDLESDLRSIRKTTTAAGNIRFEAERGENGHADRFWALGLSLHAAKNTAAPAEAVNI